MLLLTRFHYCGLGVKNTCICRLLSSFLTSKLQFHAADYKKANSFLKQKSKNDKRMKGLPGHSDMFKEVTSLPLRLSFYTRNNDVAINLRVRCKCCKPS